MEDIYKKDIYNKRFLFKALNTNSEKETENCSICNVK